MKNIFTKYLLIGLVLTALVLPCACAKPAPPPSPAEFEVSLLDIKPPEAMAGETVSITAEVKNTGGTEGTYPVTLTLNGVKTETKVVKVAPLTTEKVSFIVTKDEPGTYNVGVDGLSDTFQLLKPTEFAVSNLVITPTIAEAGQMVTISADVNNTGEVEGSYSATLKIDGIQVETKEVTVAPSVSQTVSFTFTKDAAGRYSIDVAGLSGLIEVRLLTDTLKQLKVAYPELVQELLKLPDLEEIEAKDDEAIEDITYLALDPKYKTVFELMLNEGIKDKRKYCTPLEALLWIAYDREFNGYNPLKDYSLQTLTSDAWGNTTTSENYASERWQSFNEVVDRLNSPDLVCKYIEEQFKFDNTIGIYHQNASDIFNRKKGYCEGHGMFAAYCLGKSGFESYITTVRDGVEYHAGCLYKEGNKFYIIDSIPNDIARKVGPFATIKEAAGALSRGFGWDTYSLFDTNWTLIQTGGL